MCVGYCKSFHDSCVYFREFPDGSFIYLILYIDDILIAAAMAQIYHLTAQLKGEFEMIDLWATKKILGMEIHRDRKASKLYLSQKKYVEKVFEPLWDEKCQTSEYSSCYLFQTFNYIIITSDEEMNYMAHVPYSLAVSSIMYAMVCTHADISHAVSVVSSYMSCPGKGHWETVKWISRYLKGNYGACLKFGRSNIGMCWFRLCWRSW